eukprot:TRINITY_DN40683_c0_g1_i1.p1 TRINITY_DN40683_c0_g1~~TRINITY_DN40683_c0_g1_i1.p1  ORF type:complete len:1006 (+),score=141.83 TRINITY_DN40683_c0_g1_i1:102-3119(+)
MWKSETDASAVHLFADQSDPCAWWLQVRCPDHTGLFFKVCEVMMGYNVDICSAKLSVVDGMVDSQFELKVSRPTDAADATEWCSELEDFLVKNSADGGAMLQGSLCEGSLATVCRRLRVNPDLVSVVSFDEVDCEDLDTPSLQFHLEMEGINQAGLLTYTALVLCRSSFNVVVASISTSGGRVHQSFDLVAESEAAEQALRSHFFVPPDCSRSVPLPFHACRSDLADLQGLMASWAGRSRMELSTSSQDFFTSIHARKHSDSSDEDGAGSRALSKASSAASDAPRHRVATELPRSPRYPGTSAAPGKRGALSPKRVEKRWTSVTFKNADRYEGSCAVIDGSEKRHGLGCYTYSPRSHDAFKQYTGQWCDDRKHGHGVLFFRSGGTYIGQWVKNERSGLGVLLDSSGLRDSTAMPSTRYEGQWAGDHPHGLGVEDTEKTIYFGRFKQGSQSGPGVRLQSAATRQKGVAAIEVLPESSSTPIGIMEAIEGKMTQQAADAAAMASLDLCLVQDVADEEAAYTKELFSSVRKSSLQLTVTEDGMHSVSSSAQAELQHMGSSLRSGRSDTGCTLYSDEDEGLPRVPSRNPLDWGSLELAAFIACLGIGGDACQRLRCTCLGPGGARKLLEMSNAWFRKELGLWSPVERLVVRQALRQVLETERSMQRSGRRSDQRNDNSKKEQSSPLSGDAVLGKHAIPRKSLTLVSKISSGGFGTVYRGLLHHEQNAEDAAAGFTRSMFRIPLLQSAPAVGKRHVAVKEMKGEQQISTHEFLKEACVMASLHHPNICAFVGVCSDPKTKKHFIVSQLADGSLFDIVHQPHKIKWTRDLTALLAVEVAQGICAAIMYLHGSNLVHADLKSSNILMNVSSGNLHPLVCDFGHAAVRSVPSPHHRCGTPHWAAPEVLRGEALGPAADVYSLGVLLWEMLTQRLPHRGLTFCQVVGAVGWAGWAPDMTMLPNGLPKALRHLLRCCLAFAPKWRPRAQEAQRALRSVPRSERVKALEALEGFFQ